MTRIPKSQGTVPSRGKAAVDADNTSPSDGDAPTENRVEEPIAEVDFDATIPGEVETDSTGKNILIRDEDVTDDTSELRLLEDSEPDASESEEPEEESFDPYNSGRFNMSKTPLAKSRKWKSRSRK